MNNRISVFLASRKYSAATKTTYAHVLGELVKHPIETWDAADLLKFVERKNWGDSMRYVALAACRSFIKFEHGNRHAALTARLKRPELIPPPTLTEKDLLALLAIHDTYTAIGARDQAIIAIAADTGFRVAELARISLDDIDQETRVIVAKIKGGKIGWATYSPETAAILDRWLSYRKPAPNVRALWLAMKRGGTRGQPLTAQAIKTLFKRWSARAGVKISPHAMRRGFATITTRNGAPSRTVQLGGRWSDIRQVERYTRALELQAIQPYLPMHNLHRAEIRN